MRADSVGILFRLEASQGRGAALFLELFDFQLCFLEPRFAYLKQFAPRFEFGEQVRQGDITRLH